MPTCPLRPTLWMWTTGGKTQAGAEDNKDEFTIGVGYTIPQFFGVDLKTNYEYRVAFVNDVLDGSPRNTFGASFEKDLRGGEAKLSGEGKYVLGGTGAQKTSET